MNLLSSLFLGILQGFTEFLPVSSSGHLVIAQSMLPSFSQPGVLFDVFLHGGTLLATVFYFRKKLFSFSKRYIYFIVIGTIPAVIIGALFQSSIEKLFISTKIVGFALLVTGLMNYLTDKTRSQNKRVSGKSAGLIGLAQAVAIIPGISRSGATIFMGSKLGMKKEKAAEFSFILSIPAILGANFLQLYSHRSLIDQGTLFYIVGFAGAFLAGYLAIDVVIRLLRQGKFIIFAWYTIMLGLLVIFLS